MSNIPMARRLHPELVYPVIAEKAMETTIANGDQRGTLFTYYIILHYRGTGKLAPGCDFRDLLAWYEANRPMELASVTKP